VWEYAAALMRVLGGFLGSTGRVDFEYFGTGSGIFGRGVNNGSVSTEGELLDCAAMVYRKRCCPIPSQLRDCSG